MTDRKSQTRPLGATATLGRTGFPHVRSATGGELSIMTGAAQAGFNPIDLLYASLSACLAMSARIAASEMGVMDRITLIEVAVGGEKATEGPSRVERFDIRFTIESDLDAAEKREIVERAEGICTVSNTMVRAPGLAITISE